MTTPNIKYFLFDTETGGLDAKSNSLLTLYGLILNSKLKVVETIDLNLKPNDEVYHVWAEAMQVNRINLVEHNKKALSYSAGRTALEDILVRNTGFNGKTKIVPVGWHVNFDIGFVTEHLLPRPAWDRYFSLDTIELKSLVHFMVLSGKLKVENYKHKFSLGEIVKELDINLDGKVLHDAEVDTKASFSLFKKLIELNKK